MRFGVALALLALPSAGFAQTEIRRVGDLVEVRATTAALADVLERLGRETGMKVVYDGAPPRARVSLALPPSAPAHAVLAVLEGQGLNYLARMDPTGLKVDTLYVVSTGGATPGTPSVARGAARPPGVPSPDDDDEPEPEPEPEPLAVIQRPERPDRSERTERIERIERERLERERAAAEADDEKPPAPRPGVYTPGTVQPLLFPPGGQNGQGQNGQGGTLPVLPGAPGPLRMPVRPNPQASPSLQ
jgi:hypothetical protein